MGQLSFFSAETDDPVPGDLAGLMAAHGQAVTSPAGARISIVLDTPWRAVALVDEITRSGVRADVALSDEGSPMVRTETSKTVATVALNWRRGAVKVMPAGWVPSPRSLRMWVVAAGRRDGHHYLLGLDPHCPDSHPHLATALMRVGVAPTLVGTRGHTPALRVSGRRRISRLAATVGEPPEHSGAVDCWPDMS